MVSYELQKNEAILSKKLLYNFRNIAISFPEHARSQVKGGHSSGEIELIHVGFPT
jgi:hypothetical protein